MADEAKSASPADDKTKDPANQTADPGTSQDRSDVSSASKDGQPPKETEKSGLDIVRDVLKLDANNQPLEKEESSPSPSDDGKKAPGDDDKGEGKKPDPAASDEKKGAEKPAPGDDVLSQAEKSKFRDDPVFKKVTGELRETRTKLKEAQDAVTAEKPWSDAGRKFGTFMETSGLSPDAVQEILKIGALMVRDPAAARDELKKVMDDLDDMLGETLSADLKKKVEDGDLELEDAKRISRAEAKEKLATGRTKAAADQAKRTEDATKQSDARMTIQRTVDARVKTISESDPDFAKKEAQLTKEVIFLANQKGRQLKTVDDAIKLVNDAYENVNAFFAELAPVRREHKPDPTRGGGGDQTKKTPADLPKEASGLDVTKAALGLY